MLRLMIQKMWQKRWMNLCLILGAVLLIATVVSFPLYEKAAYDRMLRDEFKNYISSEGAYPALINMNTFSQRDKGGKTMSKIEKKMDTICNDLGVKEKQKIDFIYLQRGDIISEFNRADSENLDISLGSLTDLTDHIEMLSGEPYSETGITDDGKVEVIVSQGCMISLGLLVNETFTFEKLKFPDGTPIKIVIKGVFNMDESDPYYWQVNKNDILKICFMNPALFRDSFMEENASDYNIHYNAYTLFEYINLTNEQVSDLIAKTTHLTKKSKYKSVTEDTLYLPILEAYVKKVNRISATLLILQVPVLIMLAAFLLMISSQMYEMEKNEISVIKSRGSSRGQIFRIYLYQGIVITVIAGLIGIPLGGYFAKILGASESFLDFNTKRLLNITYTTRSLYYALAAMLVTLISITLPAIPNSKVSIVNLKQSKNVNKKSLWKKLYLDIVLLLIAGYGYYNFSKNMKNLSGTVLSGESLDPLLYISSSLFIIGMGLLYLRIQPLFVKLIFTIFKKHLKPADYISLTEAIKQSGKQQLIILFLIMTVSLGMYHSTVARTILDNALKNTQYVDACDMILSERWKQQLDENRVFTGNYIEPDYKRFAKMDFADKYTKVYLNDTAVISEGKSSSQVITLMGIHTKEFGEITHVDRDILSKPYYEYLNELAVAEEGCIVSENFKNKLGYDIGDTIYIKITVKDQKKVAVSYKIVDFFEYFPSYSPTKVDLNPDGTSFEDDNYLVVTHFDLLRKDIESKPYEIWMSLKDDATTEAIYDFIDSNDIRVNRYVNRVEDIEETIEDPLLQGTNGVLTLGFVVTLLLCAVGYLIYWIMSIKERELIFGVLRASGFHKNELVKMLLNEQILSGVLSVLAGVVIGYLSSRLYVPIIQLSYASQTQVLPLSLTMNMTDQLRLFIVIAAVMLTCLVALITLLFRMNVTKALKLGEE